MDRRTYEGPMEWEYQGRGPLDASSPFTHAGKSQQQSAFASPSKFGNKPSLFSHTPSKPLPALPQSSLFHPRIQHANTAPPFRNPAFTTPRKPFDDTQFSEAESSPGLTEQSDYANDTPEVDRFSDLNMSTITPSKVDKFARYAKSGHQTKRHAPGKGEIARASRDYPALRKRKRHNGDRDVGSLRYHSSFEDSEDSDDADDAGHRRRGRRSKMKENKGWFMSAVEMVNMHPSLPDNLKRWTAFFLNLGGVSLIVFITWNLWTTVRNDILTSNNNARRDIMAKAHECQQQYDMNECDKKILPALREMCDKWDECRFQDPEGILVVKNTAKQIAIVINEFANSMELKGFILIFGIMLIFVAVNRWGASGGPDVKTSIPVPPTPAPVHNHPQPSGFPETSSQAYMWVPIQTPSRRRQIEMDDEATDTDGASPPVRHSLMPPPQTPSRRQSPSKERMRSPVKSSRKLSRE